MTNWFRQVALLAGRQVDQKLHMKKQRALIMINGVPGDRINYVRGLRQGDPISLMLVVIAMEALTALISKAERSDVLSALPGI